MKKLLFLLLLAAAAWGFYEGTDESRAVRPAGHAYENRTAPREDGTVSGFFRTFIEGASGLSLGDLPLPERAPEPEATPKADTDAPHPFQMPQEAETLFSDVDAFFHFRDAMERRLDRSRFVPSEDIPPLLKKAVVAAEDRRFYEHGAVDLWGIGRAAVANSLAGETVEGGSTLSQQTVKNLFLSGERTMTRKIRELFLAAELERTYTKDEILEIYLNTIYFGHGAYGVGEACRIYFDKEPSALSPAQCALIAGLPQAPSAYDPIDHPDEAKKRRAVVLALMTREGTLSPAEAAQAAAEPLFD